MYAIPLTHLQIFIVNAKGQLALAAIYNISGSHLVLLWTSSRDPTQCSKCHSTVDLNNKRYKKPVFSFLKFDGPNFFFSILFYRLQFIICIYYFSPVVGRIWVTTHQLRKAVWCLISLDILLRRQITHFMNNTMITLLLVSVHKHTITRTSKKERVISVNIKCTVNECWVWWIVLVAFDSKYWLIEICTCCGGC